MNRHLVAAVLLSGLAACAVRDNKPAGRGDPAYVFPHSPHVENDVACVLCHASIPKSVELEARVRHVALKPQDACKDCHDFKDPKFKLPKVPARTREFGVRINHKAHLAKAGVTCKTCHQELPDVGATKPAEISMSACTACHNHQADYLQARCTPCHVDLKRYEKPVAVFQHNGDFLKTHGTHARPTAESCAQCHEQTFCADCHSATTVSQRQAILFPEQVQRDFIHRGDYVSRHMIDAEASPASCRRCHGSRFCDECHTQQNITQRSVIQPRNPHPAGWGTDVAAGDKFHGNQARKNIVVCAACHDHGAAAICTTCHGSVGGQAGVGGNPHPSSFITKHKGDDKAKSPVCLACHR